MPGGYLDSCSVTDVITEAELEEVRQETQGRGERAREQRERDASAVSKVDIMVNCSVCEELMDVQVLLRCPKCKRWLCSKCADEFQACVWCKLTVRLMK